MANRPHLPAIAPTNSGALTTSTGPQRIATRMAEDLLNVARSRERALDAQRCYRIGEYEFREADHEQLQRWARMLDIGAEDVVAEFQTVSAWIARVEHDNFDDQNGTTVSLFDFSFDKETYAQAKPLFIEMVNAAQILDDDIACVREAMRVVIKMMMDKFGAETMVKMKSYIVRFLSDVRDGSISPEELNAPDTNSRVERDSGKSATEPAVDDTFQDGCMLAGFHIEAGARKFTDLAKAIASDLGVPMSTVRPYLRSWYNGARDMMEDSNVSIEDMDGPDAVRAALAEIDSICGYERSISQEELNAPDTNSRVERDSGKSATEPAVSDTFPNGRGTDATWDNQVPGRATT